ncbi:MAG: tartrate dehydrogenase, partial [Acidobacteria bacterium]|nr:tartrate dehydrogenase [Acidobacteriota bacterium]
MSTQRIAVLPGDGIGTEVTPAGLSVLDAVAAKYGLDFELTMFDWGTDYYFEHGRMMPEDALDQLVPFDALLLGAIGHPKVQDNITL